MKKMILSLILCVIFVAPAFCETSLWIAKTDSTELYIGGTIHILRESDYPLPVEFDKAYDASQALVFETDIAKISTPETQQMILAKAMFADGKTLDKVLTPEIYEALKVFCADRGINLEQMNMLKPALILVTLVGIEAQKLGANQEGIDQFYYNKAIENTKAIKELETIEEQITLITSLGEGDENAYVKHTLDELGEMGEKFDSMAKAWRAGDMSELYDLFIDEMKSDFPKLYKDALYNRNMAWMPKIESFLKSKETEFVLVGVAHLVGEDGVIEQLKKLGYSVERFK